MLMIKNFIFLLLTVVLFACESSLDNGKEQRTPEVEYDGYVEPNSLSPEYFKGKYYFDLSIKVESNSQIYKRMLRSFRRK